MFRDNLIKPFEIPANINGNSYLEFIQNSRIDELEKLPLNQAKGMWFMPGTPN